MTVNLPVCEDVCLAAFYLEIAIKEKKKIEIVAIFYLVNVPNIF